jgi:hypothetical protein
MTTDADELDEQAFVYELLTLADHNGIRAVYDAGVTAERKRQPQIVCVDGVSCVETYRTVQPGEWVEIHYSIEAGEAPSE